MAEAVFKKIAASGLIAMVLGCVIHMIYAAVTYNGIVTSFPLWYVLLVVAFNWGVWLASGVVIYLAGLFIIRKFFAEQKKDS